MGIGKAHVGCSTDSLDAMVPQGWRIQLIARLDMKANMPTSLYLNVIAAIVYCAATGFTKISVFIFYLRIFPSRNFHIAVWTIVFIAGGYSLASILANIFSCRLIASSWDLTITGTCMHRPVFYFANAGLGIFTDFATVLVPMYVTLK